MNWSDFFVLAVILGFGIVGLFNGFILSVYRLASFFLSAVLSIKFYPVLSKLLLQTALYDKIKASIFNNLMLQQKAQAPGAGKAAKEAAADAVVQNLSLPGFLKDAVKDRLPDPSKLVDMKSIVDAVSTQLARIATDVISLVLIYVIIRIALIFAKYILQGITKLPVIKQVDKAGGFALGAVEGLLSIYILFAIIMLFQAAPKFKTVYDTIEGSILAKFFYENNFLVNWMFPR